MLKFIGKEMRREQELQRKAQQHAESATVRTSLISNLEAKIGIMRKIVNEIRAETLAVCGDEASKSDAKSPPRPEEEYSKESLKKIQQMYASEVRRGEREIAEARGQLSSLSGTLKELEKVRPTHTRWVAKQDQRAQDTGADADDQNREEQGRGAGAVAESVNSGTAARRAAVQG